MKPIGRAKGPSRVFTRPVKGHFKTFQNLSKSPALRNCYHRTALSGYCRRYGVKCHCYDPAHSRKEALGWGGCWTYSDIYVRPSRYPFGFALGRPSSRYMASGIRHLACGVPSASLGAGPDARTFAKSRKTSPESGKISPS